MKCKLCNRVANRTELCVFHLKAARNLAEKYEVWKKALGLTWDEYLDEIRKNSLTGEWAKQVANHLIRDEETRDVKEI